MKARLLALALATLVVACGGVAGPGSDPSPTPESSVAVTKADNQQTVRAHVGDHIQVALGEDINWQLEPPDGRVLHPGIEPELHARARDAGDLARKRCRPFDDQGEQRNELPERRSVSAPPRALHHDGRGNSLKEKRAGETPARSLSYALFC
jgi:hypothetical protein